MVGLIAKHMSTTVFNGIAKGHGVGLFAKSEGIGIYPENYNLRDTPECKGKFFCVLCPMSSLSELSNLYCLTLISLY